MPTIDEKLRAEAARRETANGNIATCWLIEIERFDRPRRKLDPLSAVASATSKSWDLLVSTGELIGQMAVGAANL